MVMEKEKNTQEQILEIVETTKADKLPDTIELDTEEKMRRALSALFEVVNNLTNRVKDLENKK